MTNAQSIAQEVLGERGRQDAKWGEQNHPDGTGSDHAPLLAISRQVPGHGNLAGYWADVLAEAAKAATNDRASRGTVTWSDILLEEVLEAFAESDSASLRAELVQVAAVAQQWVQAIDRREGRA